MVTRKSSTGQPKKLKVKKETLKDLDARRKVRGGGTATTTQPLKGGLQTLGLTCGVPQLPGAKSLGCGQPTQ